MKSIFKNIQFISFFLVIITVNAQSNCTTPHNNPGFCVWLENCPRINDIAKNPRRTHSQSRFFADSHCKTEIINNVPKIQVCCDKDVAKLGCRLPEYPDKGSFEIDGAKVVEGQSVPAFTVLKYKCEKNYEPYPQNAIYCQRNFMWDENITCVKLNVTLPEESSGNLTLPICTTPDHQQGVCKDINQCPQLLSLITKQKLISENDRQFLLQSSCQGQARVNVCCGSNTPNVDQVATTTERILQRPKVNPDPDDLLPTDCGPEIDMDRIIGGNETAIDQYPWMALIEYRNHKNPSKFGCSASLINKRYLVTAGYCVVGNVLNIAGTPVNVILGEYDRSTEIDCLEVAGGGKDCADPVVTNEIEQIIPHPQYKPETTSGQKNDIALIRMNKDAPSESFFIKPICLPKRDITVNLKSRAITTLVVAGWGDTIGHRSSPSDRKRHVFLPFIALNECRSSLQDIQGLTNLWDKQLCAGEDGKDACRGDTGGPLMYTFENELKYYLIGVMSFGPTPCAVEGFPVVYTNVYKYIDWIKGELKP